MGNAMTMLLEQLRKAAAQFPYMPRALSMVWHAARVYTLAWGVLLLIQGVLPVATVYLTRMLVDSIANSYKTGGSWEDVRGTLLLVALMALVMLLTDVLRSIVTWVRTGQSELFRDHIRNLIHEKSVGVDLAFYESPEFYDHLHRACYEASYRPLSLMENLGSLVQSSITLLAMSAVLLQFGLWLPAALVLTTIPALLVVLRRHRAQHDLWLKTTVDERRSWYCDWLLTSRETAAEVRIFGLGSHFRSAHQEVRTRLRTQRLKFARDSALYELAARTLALLITGAAMAWMVWQALLGLLTLGNLALFYQAFSQGKQMMSSLLENIGQIYSNSLFLENLFEFLGLQPMLKEADRPAPAPQVLKDGIRFDAVSFHYPESENLALSNFNLTVPAGKIVAIVGSNGAGKSTLVKLLCRLYDPDSGVIQLDGVDLRSYSIEKLRGMITILFQQPVQYSALVRENIALGNLGLQDNMPAISGAAEGAGAENFIRRLPRGYETLLGKWFSGGAELSVGEWQRLALARAFLRQAPIMILDEPTSAMDSWAEADWLDRFGALAAGRTTILITHRFTTAMRADIIHVVEEGRIVESGSHGELLALGGRYAASWTRQFSGQEHSRQGFGRG
jgi:ATP-binding cassette, subfamily B, bacterial